MIRKILLAGAASALLSTNAFAANAACPNVSLSSLQSALKSAVSQTAGTLGFGLNMWATVVAPDGHVCVVANSSGTAAAPGANSIQGQWLASRVISAQKAYTAATLSLGTTPSSGSGTGVQTGKVPLSTANLYSAVQPGGSLFGLSDSNPVAAAGAYGDRISTGGNYAGPVDTANFGTSSDPMIGQIIGGINTFGGGLALYTSAGVKVGAVGVSGDSSCADHIVAWNVRHNLSLDHLLGMNAFFGTSASRPDNIVFDIGANGKSASGWGHPNCGAPGLSNQDAQSAANGKEPEVVQ
ncbi:MAG: hypothetical protein ACR652_09860 [Methylocystis sp.]|uniref:hypothetical protein n=1 Tax=Methylocystis sp. TaxID=1911079 RepID=UPI003DA3CDB1